MMSLPWQHISFPVIIMHSPNCCDHELLYLLLIQFYWCQIASVPCSQTKLHECDIEPHEHLGPYSEHNHNSWTIWWQQPNYNSSSQYRMLWDYRLAIFRLSDVLQHIGHIGFTWLKRECHLYPLQFCGSDRRSRRTWSSSPRRPLSWLLLKGRGPVEDLRNWTPLF